MLSLSAGSFAGAQGASERLQIYRQVRLSG
jgi:hypothetical protein